jgi:hypothetical protein
MDGSRGKIPFLSSASATIKGSEDPLYSVRQVAFNASGRAKKKASHFGDGGNGRKAVLSAFGQREKP